jgi:hypothetical protein
MKGGSPKILDDIETGRIRAVSTAENNPTI